MKNLKLTAAAAAMVLVSASAMAAPKPTVYVNSYIKPNYAIVSVDATGENAICHMEVTDEAGSMVYLSKRVVPVSAAQYILNIARLKDGVYTVNFGMKKGSNVSKMFVVRDGNVVK